MSSYTVATTSIAGDKTPGIIDADELDGISTGDLDDAERAIAALRARKAINPTVIRMEGKGR